MAMAEEAAWRRASAGSSCAIAPTLTSVYGSAGTAEGRKFSRYSRRAETTSASPNCNAKA
jgi:hypothetical protein